MILDGGSDGSGCVGMKTGKQQKDSSYTREHHVTDRVIDSVQIVQYIVNN